MHGRDLMGRAEHSGAATAPLALLPIPPSKRRRIRLAALGGLSAAGISLRYRIAFRRDIFT